ncbi:hypothetical protein ACFFMN_11985 [Planobispora siamensis]|uniref:Uncharacterized protein n=1 Tax=Planobispora siamensis TaxID=936338 RepID=A0A8J3WGZ0_9ACTN|nr:hypothetical protein [Planobispora siamensis]GIH89929.1 hypothetical protein Psi01_05590 [Planobispora siamensis]
MNHVLRGLAANVAPPSDLVDRLITAADEDIAGDAHQLAVPRHEDGSHLEERITRRLRTADPWEGNDLTT